MICFADCFNSTKNIFFRTTIFCFLSLISTASYSDIRGLQWDGPAKEIKTPYLQGTYHALIIGNDSYTDKNGVWHDLKTAANDANELAKLLKSDYGFEHVKLMTNVGRRDILIALNELSDRIEPADSVLVYYAGHGHLEEDKNRGYWIPADATGGDNSTYLRNSTIRDEINILAERTKHTLVISDSCFSGALMRSNSRASTHEVGIKGYYQKVASKKSVQVLAAGGKEFVDDSYRNSGHSPFTYFLISELKHNNKKLLSLAELATNVSIAVANSVDQTPESGVLLGAGDELGQFIFAKVTIKDNVTELTLGTGKLPEDSELVDGIIHIEGEASKNEKPSNIDDVVLPTLRL